MTYRYKNLSSSSLWNGIHIISPSRPLLRLWTDASGDFGIGAYILQGGQTTHTLPAEQVVSERYTTRLRAKHINEKEMTAILNNSQKLGLARGRYSDIGPMEIRLVSIVHSDTPGPINSDLPSFSTTPRHVPNSTTVGGPFPAWGWEFFPSLLPKQSHYRRCPQQK